MNNKGPVGVGLPGRLSSGSFLDASHGVFVHGVTTPELKDLCFRFWNLHDGYAPLQEGRAKLPLESGYRLSNTEGSGGQPSFTLGAQPPCNRTSSAVTSRAWLRNLHLPFRIVGSRVAFPYSYRSRGLSPSSR